MRIGMGQILVEGGAIEANLGRAAAMVEKAAAAGCDLVVLPECLDLGWTWPDARRLAVSVPGERSDRLSAAAKRCGIWLAAGLTERDGDRVFNTAILVSNEGELIGRHRKINELSIAHDYYDVGDRLTRFPTPFGPIGMTVCADNFPDSLVFGHALARMGVRLLVSPCAWAVDADHDNTRDPYGGLWFTAYRQLASLYDIAVVGVSSVGWLTAGPWKGRKCIGNSIAVGPGGRTLAVGPYGADAESLTVVEVDLTEAAATGTEWAERLRERGYPGP